MFALILCGMTFRCPRIVHESASVDLKLLEAAQSKDAEQKLADQREELLLAWLLALGRFHATQGTGFEGALREMVTSMNEAFRRAWGAADFLGQSQWKVPWTSPLSAESEALLRDQAAYMGGFARDVAAGLPGKNGRTPETARSQLYGAVLGAAFHQGMVDRAPPRQEIQWRLGLCKHCRDCPNLAAGSPYTFETLPTFPGAGATACGARCRCWLEFRTRPTMDIPAASVLGGYLLGTRPAARETQEARTRAVYAARRAERSTGATRAFWQTQAAASSPEEVVRGSLALDGRAARAGDVALLFERWGVYGLAVGSLAPERLREFVVALLLALGITEETAPEARPSRLEVELPANETLVVSLVGNGLEAQRRAMVDCVRAMAESKAAVALAPLAADGFSAALDEIGIWIRGDAAEVRAMLASFGRLHSANDVEMAIWTGV